jgi:hydrophobic/amphiphilic exporter-1 (mainly G- bacteria), HAE1 family
MARGANAVDVTNRVHEVMDELAQRFPDDLVYDIVYDTTHCVHATIDEVLRTMVEAFILTIIPLVAVPVSLIGAIAVQAAARHAG